LKPPYLLNAERSGVGGILLYRPGGKAQLHHCCLRTQSDNDKEDLENNYV
jgi:hypothetical protein